MEAELIKSIQAISLFHCQLKSYAYKANLGFFSGEQHVQCTFISVQF